MVRGHRRQCDEPIAIVGQVTGNYKSLTETTTDFGVPVTLTADLKLHTFMGGVRFSARQHPRVVPFAKCSSVSHAYRRPVKRAPLWVVRR